MSKFLNIIAVICLFMIASMNLYAQDVLITKDGEVKQVYGVEIGPSSVFFKLENKADASIQSIERSKVFMLKYADGRKMTFDGEAPIQNTAPSSASPAASATTIGVPDEARNTAILNGINNNVVTYSDDAKKGKKAKRFFCQFRATPTSVFANKDVEIAFNAASVSPFAGNDEGLWDRVIEVTVKNKTSRTVFVDLGNSFFIRGGESTPYYVPTATSNTTGTNSGVAVNLGGVTNALGIGGAAGQIAQGTTVGGGKSSATTTTVYSQRIVAVPPMSSKKIGTEYLVPFNTNFYKGAVVSEKSTNYRGSQYHRMDVECDMGQVFNWTENNSPIKWGSFVSYSFDEGFSSSAYLKSDFYMFQLIGYPKPNGVRGKISHLNKCFNGLTGATLFFNAAGGSIW